MSSKNFASREVMNLNVLDYRSRVPVWRCDYANITTTEMTSGTTYAFGGFNHVRRVAFNGDREAQLVVSTQVRSFEAYRLLTGAQIKNDATFLKRDELTAVEDSGSVKITLSKTPVTGSVNVFAAADDCGTPLTVTVDGKDVTGTDLTVDSKYVAYYTVNMTQNTQRLTLTSDTFPRDVAIFAETLVKTEDGALLPYKMVVYKATPEANLNLEFTNNGEPSELELTFNILADAENNMIDLILIEDEDEDSAIAD